MKFIEVHPVDYPERRIYINTDNTLRSPEHCVEDYDKIKMKIIKALED